jgi:hypothetical protein
MERRYARHATTKPQRGLRGAPNNLLLMVPELNWTVIKPRKGLFYLYYLCVCIALHFDL